MVRNVIGAIAALLSIVAVPVHAQRAAPIAVAQSSAGPITAAQRSAAVDAIIAAVNERYVFPERVPAIEARLRQSLAEARYDTEAPGEFAERVTEDLRQSSGDRHMYLNFDPTRHLLASAVEKEQGEDIATTAYWRQRAVRTNHGLAEMRILPGNIRYLRITGFEWINDETGAAYDAAARFLKEGDAIVIDLRGNGGGSHGAVRYLVSHFLEPNQLEMTFLAGSEPPSQSRALEFLPAGRLTERPLYVLIDGRTGSAAEAFAYDVQQFRVGRLVGERTSGAANNNTFVPIAPAFMLSVSFGRPVHPVSQSNWEQVGVEPDVPSGLAAALDTAQGLALEELLQRPDADPAARADWEWARASVEARLNPISIPDSRLRPLVGTYGANRIVFRDARLWLERADREPGQLIPMDDAGLFTVEGYGDALRLRFTGEAMEILWIDQPAPIRVTRSSD